MRRLDKLLMYKFTLLLLLISCATFAQKSVLYNEHRQLIVDTSFHIDEHTYKNLPKIEKEVLPLIYRNIPLTHMSLEGPKNDVIIVKLSFNNSKCEFETLRAKNPAFESAVYTAFKSLKKEYESAVLRGATKEELLLYVPIKFEERPTTFHELLKKNNAITIQQEPLLIEEGGFPDTVRAEDWTDAPKLEKKP